MKSVESLNASIQEVAVNVASSGNNTVISGYPGMVIIVLQYLLISTVQMNVTFESSGGTVLAGPLPVATNGGACANYSKFGWFRTLVGEDLVINLSGANQLGGSISYIIYAAQPHDILP